MPDTTHLLVLIHREMPKRFCGLIHAVGFMHHRFYRKREFVTQVKVNETYVEYWAECTNCPNSVAARGR